MVIFFLLNSSNQSQDFFFFFQFYCFNWKIKILGELFALYFLNFDMNSVIILVNDNWHCVFKKSVEEKKKKKGGKNGIRKGGKEKKRDYEDENKNKINTNDTGNYRILGCWENSTSFSLLRDRRLCIKIEFCAFLIFRWIRLNVVDREDIYKSWDTRNNEDIYNIYTDNEAGVLHGAGEVHVHQEIANSRREKSQWRIIEVTNLIQPL